MNKTNGFTNSLKNWMLGACALGLVGAGSAQAALLGVLPGYPDIRTNNMAANYDGSTFTMSSTDSTTYVLTPFSGGTPTPLLATSYEFTASVNASGVFGTGSLTILNGATTLLDATVDAFGWEFIDAVPGVPGNTSGKFDALFSINASDPSLGFGSNGVMLGSFELQLTADAANPWGSSFTSDPTNTGLVNTAASPVPVPSTLSLLAIAALGFARQLRRAARA